MRHKDCSPLHRALEGPPNLLLRQLERCAERGRVRAADADERPPSRGRPPPEWGRGRPACGFPFITNRMRMANPTTVPARVMRATIRFPTIPNTRTLRPRETKGETTRTPGMVTS